MEAEVTNRDLKTVIYSLVLLLALFSGAIWLGMNTKRLPTNGGATATAMALSATPTETIAATKTTATPTPTQMATPAATATATPPAMAETATAVARAASGYKEALLELRGEVAKTATREAKWREDSRNARKEEDQRLRAAGCYERPCVLVTWGSGYDRWSSVVANGISVADGNSIFNKKVLVEWDNYGRPESVVAKPSTRKTREGEPYAVWVSITAYGELRLTELPIGEIYGN